MSGVFVVFNGADHEIIIEKVLANEEKITIQKKKDSTDDLKSNLNKLFKKIKSEQ